MIRCPILILSLVFVAGASPAADAASHHHHRNHAVAGSRIAPVPTFDRTARTSQEPLGGGEANPYASYTGPGSAVLNATVRAAREPGVTLELAPDAKETATGGPVGGPPGFDGS